MGAASSCVQHVRVTTSMASQLIARRSRWSLLLLKTNTKSQHVGFPESAATGDAAKIIALIERCVDINASDRTGRTAFHLASSEGHCNIIELLIQRGVLLKKDLNLQDNQGHEALQDSAAGGHDEWPQMCSASAGKGRSKTFGDGANHARKQALLPGRSRLSGKNKGSGGGGILLRAWLLPEIPNTSNSRRATSSRRPELSDQPFLASRFIG
jgi:hypothetical protein